jgi:hypothetical protein
MQIDFHHAVTYICARFAGFPHSEAEVIAHSAQYVDDATADGEIWFENGMIFPRTASAHKMLDYKNTDELGNHRVWLPFHFLPGNNLELSPSTAVAYNKEEFMRRCICRPNSLPAQEMMAAVIKRQDRPYALYRLGISAHVFMDTWAHQGFVGYQHQVNIASEIKANDTHHEKTFGERLKDFFKQDWDETKSDFVGQALPLGHGSVLSYPDRPYLRWSYTNGLDERVERDNPKDFVEAAQQVYQHFRRYRDYQNLGNEVFNKEYPYPEQFEVIAHYVEQINDEDGEARHKRWLNVIASGELGFSEQLRYIDKGEGSWKQLALETQEDIADMEGMPGLPFPASFLTSHWKLFHDGIQAHRFFVLHELLPKYGLLSG